jgi:hypothetical protein
MEEGPSPEVIWGHHALVYDFAPVRVELDRTCERAYNLAARWSTRFAATI